MSPVGDAIMQVEIAPVAQRIEQSSPKALVGGSTPSWGTIPFLQICNFMGLNPCFSEHI